MKTDPIFKLIIVLSITLLMWCINRIFIHFNLIPFVQGLTSGIVIVLWLGGFHTKL